MAKTNLIVGDTKVEKAPAKFSEKSLKEKLLTVLEIVKGLEIQSAKGKNNKAWKEFIEMVAQAVETGNFDITEEGKITINLVTPENRAQAEELVKALNSKNIKDVNDLNNPDLILAEVKSLLKYISELEASNADYETENKELTKKLEQSQEKIKEFEAAFGNLELEVALAERIIVRATGMDIKDIQEKVKEHNEKNPDNQISTIVYLAQKVEEIQAKEAAALKSKKKGNLGRNLLVGGLAFSTLLGFAGAAHHAAKQKDLEEKVDGYVVTIENQNAQISDLLKIKENYDFIKDGLTGAGYSYITDDNIDLEGLIEDLGEGEYSVETQQAYDEFIAYLESQGIKYEDLLDENGNYDPDLCPENIEAYVTSSIKYLNSIQGLDGKLDDMFNNLGIVDENGNAVTINTFESRAEAYGFVMKHLETVKSEALETLQSLEPNANPEEFGNAVLVILEIDKSIKELQGLAQANQEAYEEAVEQYNQAKAENEALQKENEALKQENENLQKENEDLQKENEALKQENENLQQNGNSQGGVEEEEQEKDNNQTVSGGQGSQDSATGDSGKNPTGGKKPVDQESEYGD